MSILNELKKLEQSNCYPFHMPGHKRVSIGEGFPYGIDITEIYGFDDLHDAEGIIKEAQDAAAKLYGSKQCYYLVNGSTCGILSAISAAVPMNGRILVARNCHKAVYHGIQLRNAYATYLYPEADVNGIFGPVEPELVRAAVEKAKENGKRFDACVITSPTYEGVVSDISEIAKILHEEGIVLIVDEAHGAHFGFHEAFPENAVKLGADVVITSIHKTLPAPTQTALLHLCSSRISKEKLKGYLDIYETSSPSYVLMAAMEQALIFSEKESKKKDGAFVQYVKRLENFYDQAGKLKNLRVLRFDDPSKIVVTGKGLAQILRQKYEIEVEMESLCYVILMTSVMDSEEGFQRLIQALQEIDENHQGKDPELLGILQMLLPKQALRIGEAKEEKMKQVFISEAVGRISGDYICLYPPGIPIVAPGEYITEEIVTYLEDCQREELSVKGLQKNQKVTVLEGR
ncbi:MAG: aminotransferase class V-fold PLP-dependent enzyme [Lachnospiraceae bacterium]|nr:aminotransferase class V-fold PLP-dependent enzyme [Lachnospiraceae bacterium]